MLSNLKNLLNKYDPYGFRYMSAGQGLFVILVLFLVNFCFSIPNFEKLFCLPAFGLITITMESGFRNRIRNISVFFMMTIFYAILLSIVQSYLYLLVLSVGFCIGSFYALSTRFPYLLNMVPSIHIVANILIVPYGGDWSHIYILFLNAFTILIITVISMYFFPEVYFLRMWLRALQFTLKEFETKLSQIINQSINEMTLTTSHLIHLQEFTRDFSCEKYKKNVVRISLRCMSFYSFIVALLYNYEKIQEQELKELVLAFDKFYQGISSYQPLYFNFTHTDNPKLANLHKKLNLTIQEWNYLCAKI